MCVLSKKFVGPDGPFKETLLVFFFIIFLFETSDTIVRLQL